MAEGAERADRFLRWAKEADPSLRVADWRPVALELFERAEGGEVAPQHVEQLIDHYRRSLLGPRKIITASEVAEQLLAWQATVPPVVPSLRLPTSPPPPAPGFSPPSSPGAEFSPPPSPGAELSTPEPDEAFSPYSPPTPPPRRTMPTAPPEADRDFNPSTSPGLGMPFRPGFARPARSRAPDPPPEDEPSRPRETEPKKRSRSGTLAEALDLESEMDELELELNLDGDPLGSKPKR